MRRTRLRTVLSLLVVGVAIAVVVARSRTERAIDTRVDDLLAAARSPSGVYTSDDLDGLPSPVRRYFEHVLTEGQPYVRTANVDHSGEFRLGDVNSSWKPFTSEQYYTVDPPGFVWDAEIELAPLCSIRTVDSYVGGECHLQARLFSTLSVANSEPGPELSEGELSRYLAEAVWFPTALLPTMGVEWDPVDDTSARATLEHGETTVSLVFSFNEADEVEMVFSPDRARAVDGAFEPTPWTGTFRSYAERAGMRIPLDAEVAWNLPEGDLAYWRGHVDTVDYGFGERDSA